MASNSYNNDDEYRKAHGLLNKSWVPGPVLGAGAYGAPQIWLKQDESGRIIDRVAMKDTESPHYQDVGRSYKIPNEVFAPLKLQHLPGGNNVVMVRSWRQDERIRKVRIYTEYCPQGTLSSLIKDYQLRYGVATTVQQINDAEVPEAFCWHALWCLTQVGLLMERGAVHKRDVPQGTWPLIVHRDIKPDNIFLSGNQGFQWRGYPTTKLGDWGLSVLYANGECSGRGQGLLSDYRFSPPEVRQPAMGYLEGLGPPHRYPARLTSRTNVWAVGLQIWSLMQMENGDHSMDEGKRDWQETQDPTPFRVGAVNKYSTQLRGLVMDCLRYLPHERPSFEDIYNEILMDTLSPRKAEVNRLRESPPEDLGFRLFYKREGYPLRSMLYDEARNDPNFYNQIAPPPSPPVLAPTTAEQADSVDELDGGLESLPMLFPPQDDPSEEEKAERKRAARAAWKLAEQKRKRARAAEQVTHIQARHKLDQQRRQEAQQQGKSSSLMPPAWSPLTPNDFGRPPASGAKRKATNEDLMEGLEMEQKMPAMPKKAARNRGRRRERSADPGASNSAASWRPGRGV
ncbi:uncharacterized protein CLAFUR5_20196 [Fulvia fulva]|uniref:uncharacterized protein n=1 Tax=Passalora fulva TaxID=5499 RepID=UPI002852BF5B|nr:uncharacterized protein CLAFUR5_20196 [Fulvia fulva]KAK4628660.1 hypothetical protein CLAFUR0_05223 [Fulvia fulva]WMI39018.1 hypothetical protein CLAFUR5_20196 [Fulvia fulva]